MKIVNLERLGELGEQGHGRRFRSRHARINVEQGARKLGYNVTEVPPGCTAFPYHFHHVNEELFIVLEGQGTLRSPEGTQPIGPGDVICCPPGPEGAHQLLATGAAPLRYLAISTMEDPEVVEYPDSGKYGVTVGRPIGGKAADAKFRKIAFARDAVDYWAGEDAE
jgi:uncharacterized cupin superfamily protein